MKSHIYIEFFYTLSTRNSIFDINEEMPHTFGSISTQNVNSSKSFPIVFVISRSKFSHWPKVVTTGGLYVCNQSDVSDSESEGVDCSTAPSPWQHLSFIVSSLQILCRTYEWPLIETRILALSLSNQKYDILASLTAQHLIS